MPRAALLSIHAVLAEAESLPLPGAAGQITVRWAG
jgi:hypothetical protein